MGVFVVLFVMAVAPVSLVILALIKRNSPIETLTIELIRLRPAKNWCSCFKQQKQHKINSKTGPVYAVYSLFLIIAIFFWGSKLEYSYFRVK